MTVLQEIDPNYVPHFGYLPTAGLTRQDVVEVINDKTKQLVGYATISVTDTQATVSGYAIQFENKQLFSNRDRVFARQHIYNNFNDGLPYDVVERWELLRERIEEQRPNYPIVFQMMHGHASKLPDIDFKSLRFENPVDWGVALIQNKPVIVIN